MKLPFHHIRNAHSTFEHFHRNMHHAFVLIFWAIIGMLRGVSHIVPLQLHASRQWWGFITSDFWEQSPTHNNIKYALFGDGTPWSTAYTRTWSTSCIPTTVQYLPSNFSGWAGNSNTIYILNSWNYTLTSPMGFSNKSCSAIVGIGDVTIKTSLANNIKILWSNNIILDNIKINGQWIWDIGLYIHSTANITLNNVDWYGYLLPSVSWYALQINYTHHLFISNSRFYNNDIWVSYSYGNNTQIGAVINNSHFYNNNRWLVFFVWSSRNTVNNSQFYNNKIWMFGFISTITSNNNVFYNNDVWFNPAATYVYSNNDKIYNNTTWINWSNALFEVYGTLKLFNNATGYSFDVWSSGLVLGSIAPINSRSYGTIDTWSTLLDYDRFTNPQNGSWERLLSGTNRTLFRWPQTFNANKRPIRYVFWLNIPKQTTPVRYNSSTLEEYGSDGSDYITTRYIAEPESTLSAEHQDIVNQYFWPWSAYTENRDTNWCSLSAFQIKTLSPGTFTYSYPFEDHTIYILTWGEYKYSVINGNGFVLNGNCIALIGNDHTRFTQNGWGGVKSILYADEKHNIILDSLKIDGYYSNINNIPTGPAIMGIQFDGATNNTTINDVQVYNSAKYGIYFGQSSHHNTIINTQSFNHLIAGIHLSYASNYNVINNTQVYNNSGYGIRFADGSNRNTINNFQAYRNKIGIFWDLTTQENIINRAAIYNNSEAGISLKNSSGNTLNDIMLFKNAIGIKALYNSPGNKYYGEFKLYDNTADFEWTNGNDTYLGPSSSSLFPNGWSMTTGTNIASCLYAANPTLSWTNTTLFSSNCSDMWFSLWFRSTGNTYINYMFWLNLYKQGIPVRYDDNDILVEISSQYDASKYIAEVFAIRDDYPENISFQSSWIAQLNTWYTTNVSTASVLNITVPVTLSFDPATTSWSLIISWVTLNATTWTVSNGDTLQVKLLTRYWYNETITWTLTIGSLTTGFVITTRDISQTPTTWSFTFTNFTSTPVDIFTGSTVTVSWIETGVSASITFDPVTTSGRLEIYSGSTMVSSGTTGLLVYNGNQIKAIGQSSSWYAQTITGYVTIGLGTGTFTITTKGSDVTPPSSPTLTYPLSGEDLFFITREWIAATDTWSGIEGYVYEIAEDSSFMDIVHTGFIATTGAFGWPSTEFDATSDSYYWRLQARDRDGNTSSRSNVWRFEAIDSDEWNFDEVEDANLRTYYDSNEITIEGIKDGLSLQATIDDNGILYENGTEKWTGTLIQNDDQLFINLRSSNRYDKTISSVLTIANRELKFNVTTKTNDDGCTLSEEDEETIQDIFDSLVENYSGDENMYEEFLYTMQSMLEDEIDFTNDCNLQYLQDLINEEIWIDPSSPSTATGSHIAPNCKEYPVTFDTVRSAYTSPNFKVITYFANRDSLTRYIDSKNPGDCHINTYGVSSWIFTNTNPSKHIAANGKIYTIQTSTQGWYTSSDFSSVRYFTTIEALRAYIDTNNPPPQVWNHQVDTTFSPQIYTAPNGKEYTIYHTDRWYMSYKLLAVRYFTSLTELQSYITRNNPR